MTNLTTSAPLLQISPSEAPFRRDVLRGLRRTPKRIPSKYFYDARGSRLFDDICLLPEYYPTRTELQIMEQSADDMAAEIGVDAVIIEYGSGSSLKTRLLLDALQDPQAYVPIDISQQHLEQAAAAIAEEYPILRVHPLAGDFTGPIDLPDEFSHASRRHVYFPGSTIGNFTRRQAIKLLTRIRSHIGGDGGLLLGVDLVKDRDILRAAYNDAAGVTAEFNLNLLRRINDELDADFNLEAFRHDAIWNEDKSRIEMHLRSDGRQTVTIGGEAIEFASGESICTELSHKYTRGQLEAMAARSGMRLQQLWTDPQEWFGVAYLVSE